MSQATVTAYLTILSLKR